MYIAKCQFVSKNYVAVIVCLLFLAGCRNRPSGPAQENEAGDRVKQEIYETLRLLENKQVFFTDQMMARTNGTDLPPYVTGKSKYKVVVYTDSAGCVPCKFKAHEWAYYMRELSARTDSIYFVFIFPKINQLLEEEFIVQGMDTPVIYDTADSFVKRNRIPSAGMFHTFLLDENDRIVLVGSPVGNKKVWDLYKEKTAQGSPAE